jgi:hypothetical protein
MRKGIHNMQLNLAPGETKRLLMWDGSIDKGMLIESFECVFVLGGSGPVPACDAIILHTTEDVPGGIDITDNRQVGWWWQNGAVYDPSSRYGMVDAGTIIVSDLYVTNLDATSAFFVNINGLGIKQRDDEALLRLIKEHSQSI